MRVYNVQFACLPVRVQLCNSNGHTEQSIPAMARPEAVLLRHLSQRSWGDLGCGQNQAGCVFCLSYAAVTKNRSVQWWCLFFFYKVHLKSFIM